MSPAASALKRGLDLLLATLALLLVLPLLVALGLLVRLTSPGPALFRQPRLGRLAHWGVDERGCLTPGGGRGPTAGGDEQRQRARHPGELEIGVDQIGAHL